MAQPTKVADWALDVNDPEGKAIKDEAPIEIRQTGLLRRTPLARVWFNFIINNFYDNIRFYRDEHLKVGAVVSYSLAAYADAAAVTAAFNGTWADAGTTTSTGTGAMTIYHYIRTA